MTSKNSMKNKKQKTWHGEANRPFGAYRPCECGCDNRDGKTGVGYFSGSDGNGCGFTIWIDNEEVYQAVVAVIGEESSVREA